MRPFDNGEEEEDAGGGDGTLFSLVGENIADPPNRGRCHGLIQGSFVLSCRYPHFAIPLLHLR